MITAKTFKIIEGRIQLFDEHGNKVDGKNAKWEGNFYCYNNKLTTLKGAPKEIGGNFYCYSNKLTTLEGAPKEIGGNFNCDSNKLTTLEQKPNRGTFESYLKRGYVFADNILMKLVERIDDNTFKVRKLGNKKESYVVKQNECYSHGETLDEALADLAYKISDKDTTKYRDWNIETIVSKTDMIVAYRSITSACSFGVKDFVKNRNIPDKVSVKDVIKMTKGHYGHDSFREFFSEKS